jgi:hypothetical protein
MAIESDLNKVFFVIGLQDASKEAIVKGLTTIEDLEDLFSEIADNRVKVERTLRLIVNMAIVSDTDIRRTMFVFVWFIDNNVDPNFAWASFIHGSYISDERSRAITKDANTSAAATSTSTTPFTSTIDFSTDVLTADAKRQTTTVTPGTTATLKPHLLWKSPFVSVTCNSSNIHQIPNTAIVLASSSPMDVLEFYRKLVAAAKPAEIDLVPIGDFDPAYEIWPQNHCADFIFEMSDALALHIDQTGTLNPIDETIHILYQNTFCIVQAACEHIHFYMPCSRRQNISSMTRFQPHQILRKQRPLGRLVPNLLSWHLQYVSELLGMDPTHYVLNSVR